MQKEITRTAENADVLLTSWNNIQGLVAGGQQVNALRTAVVPDPNPRGVSGRPDLSSATFLARLEAENAMLRDRVAELALHIQKLAERPR
jgi:hypothetical protein